MNIINRNNNGKFHGYQERYSEGSLWFKVFYNNGTLIDYEEYYSNGELEKNFYI